MAQAASTIEADTPFSLSPSPYAMYVTQTLRAALHKTRFVIDGRQGLTALLGDVGMGKSSLLRLIASDYLAKPEVRVAFIPHARYKSVYAFVKGVCSQFQLSGKRSVDEQHKVLEQFLRDEYQAGRNVLLLIDEAHALTDEMLEHVRAFLNYETNTHKMIQIVLCGQLELQTRLKSAGNRALRSRVFAPSSLMPLTLPETVSMIAYRCEIAGIDNPFPAEVVKRIYEITAGIPREVLMLSALAHHIMKYTKAPSVTIDLIEGIKDDYGMKVDERKGNQS